MADCVLLATAVTMTETLLSSDPRSPATRMAGSVSHARLLEADDACPTCGSRQRLLATVLERIPDVVLLLDAAGFVMYANTAARAYAIGENENLLLSSRIHDEDRASVRDAWNRLLGLPGQTVSIQARFNRNGEWPRVVVTGENLLEEAHAGCILVTATDVLRRRERDWRLQQAQRLEAIGRLAGGIAHDFNNFLTTIQGLTRLAVEDPALPAESREDLTEVLHAADRAAAVTRRLLAFSRRQLLRPQDVDVNEQVRDSSKAISQLLGDGIVLDVVTAAGDSHAFIDPAQLEQILLNLALNSRDALPAGGVVTLRTDDALIRPEDMKARTFSVRPGGYLKLEVADSGPGIPLHLREQVFEPFFTTKSSDPASGLGLSTVYGIVKQSGGYVWIDDADGGGACVSILLPRRGDGAAARPAAAVVPAERASGTVLIVEDDSTVRFLARRVLAREGYSVLEAADGTRAAEIVASYEGAIDLLLSDVVMPGMGGRELVEHCRNDRPEMAVLLMSGYQDDAVLRQGVGTGEHELIEKPFRPDELARRVRERIAAHQHTS